MRKYIIGAVATCALLVSGMVLAAVTVTLTGPSTYADPQWKSMCISNKNGSPNYRANIEICPTSSNPAVQGACSTTEVEAATLTAGAQNIINYLINQWCTAHPGYCT
jgi:hypothetical protein